MTKYHGLGGLNNKCLFLTVQESGSLRSGCEHSWVLLRAFFLVGRQPPSAVCSNSLSSVHMEELGEERKRELSSSSYYKCTNSLQRIRPS